MPRTSIVPIILAGGPGKRLYPLASPECPKPFVCLPNGQTLLHETVRRALQIESVEEIVIVASERYASLAQQETQGALAENSVKYHLLLESAAHNTAAAITAAARYVAQEISSEAIMLVLPADQWIADVAVLAQAVQQAKISAQHGYMVVFGLEPDHASTHYGYIRRGTASAENPAVFSVDRFIEKPDEVTAQSFFHQGGYDWNSGMLCSRASSILGAVKTHAPVLLDAIMQAPLMPFARPQLVHPSPNVQGMRWNIHYKTLSGLPALSFDHAVLDHVQGLRMVACAPMGWSDMGTPEAFEQWRMSHLSVV